MSLKPNTRFSSLAAQRSTSTPRMHSARTSRPACRAGMSSRLYTAQGLTAAQRMRGSYEFGPVVMIKQPHYIGLEEARQLLAQMGVQLTLRQMQRAAEQDALGRRKLLFFVDPIERKLKIEKSDLISIYFKRQVEAQKNLRPE